MSFRLRAMAKGHVGEANYNADKPAAVSKLQWKPSLKSLIPHVTVFMDRAKESFSDPQPAESSWRAALPRPQAVFDIMKATDTQTLEEVRSPVGLLGFR